jgi:tetratricopeptide (TPR) repeat protein
MRRIIVAAVIGFILSSAYPAWGQDAMHFYKLGLESSLMNKKIHYFSKAVELDPGLSAAFLNRGLLYFYQEKYTEAIRDYQRVIELEPHEAEPYLRLGAAQMRDGIYDEAVRSLTLAIELDPKLASAYSHRAETYRLMGRIHEAIEDSTTALRLGRREHAAGRAYTTRAKAYRRLGEEELADADFHKAYRLDPDNLAYRYFTITNHLATFVSDSASVNSDRIRWLGLVALLVLLFVLIFRLVLPPPKK